MRTSISACPLCGLAPIDGRREASPFVLDAQVFRGSPDGTLVDPGAFALGDDRARCVPLAVPQTLPDQLPRICPRRS